jgi:hypothetical protein
MDALAGKLFGLFEAGEFAAARELFAPGAFLRQHFAPSNSQAVDYPTFEAGMDAMLASIGKVQYLDRIVRSFEGGFVEQHTTRLTSANGVVELKVCIVATVDSGCKIMTIEEYLDPSQLMQRKPKAKAKSSL